jgi:hypothetical protein
MIITLIALAVLAGGILLSIFANEHYEPGFVLIFIAALALVVILIIILPLHIHKAQLITAKEIEYATLKYELTTYSYDAEVNSTLNLNLMPRIQEYNTSVLNSHLGRNNPWVSWFYIDYTLYVPIIPLE